MKISFFCKFLNEAIKFFFKKNIGKKSKHSFLQPLYRGTYVSATEWNELINGQNEYVLNLAFMSTSKKKEVAAQFSNKLKNNVLIQISFHKDFYSKSVEERYSNYIEYLIDINSDVMGTSNENEEEILFNCFNVFKILGHTEDEKTKVLMLEYCSHIEIIKKKEDEIPLTPLEEKILNTIVRL
jgi:methyltransferase-like protein